MHKRGQMKLSFGMIFSIFLIVIFIIFAFYGIQKFLNFQKEIKYKQFEEDLQKDINDLWKSSSGNDEVNYYLPSEVKSICFIEEDLYNFRYNLKNSRKRTSFSHLNLEKTLGDENSFCIQNIDNRVEFKLEKNYGEQEITVSKS